MIYMIEVVYIPADGLIFRAKLNVAAPISAAQALELSAIFLKYPEASNYAIGVFAQLITKDTLLQPGDRLEIYRPLNLDPKTQRRQRAQKRSS
jgi:uncharacterized protein